MDTLGKKLKELREEYGFTLEYVANNLKTTKTSIARYEKNDREPKSEMIAALADFYNVSTDYLLGRTDERNPRPKLDEGITTIAAKKINPADDLSDEAINKINEYIEMVRMMEQNKNK